MLEEQRKLLLTVEKILKSLNFRLSKYRNLCFDIAAVRKSVTVGFGTLLIKVLSNIDSFSVSQAENLKRISSALSCFACIVGIKTRYEKLRDNLIYNRFDIPAFTPKTLHSLLRLNPPKIIRSRGGLFAEIDPVKLRRARILNNLSQRELAELAGTTKKNIYEHERFRKRAKMELIERLENILGMDVKSEPDFSIDYFPRNEKHTPKFTRIIMHYFRKLGFETTHVSCAPFDIIAIEKVQVLSCVETSGKSLEKKCTELKTFSATVEKPAFILARKKSITDTDLPVVRIDELRECSSVRDLLRLVT